MGDQLLLGGRPLRIADVVLRESDRPVTFFSLGPRVFVAAAELGRLDLIGQGSRVDYRLLLKVRDPGAVDRVAAALRAAALPDAERVQTYLTASSGPKRFFDNFLFFLSLIGTFTLLLSGIGIQSALTAFLREKRDTVAVMKALGAPGRFVVAQYLAVVAVLGAAGTLLGIAGSFLLQVLLFPLFSGFIPGGVRPEIAAATVLEGVALGAISTGLFAFLPLWRLREISPVAIFRRDPARLPRQLPFWLGGAVAAALLGALVLWQVRDVRLGLWLLGGLVGLIALAALGAEGLLRLARRLPVRALPLRQALRGLFRPGNATRPVIVTLAAALTVILTIGLLERTIDAQFVQSYPAGCAQPLLSRPAAGAARRIRGDARGAGGILPGGRRAGGRGQRRRGRPREGAPEAPRQPRARFLSDLSRDPAGRRGALRAAPRSSTRGSPARRFRSSRRCSRWPR